ncbi:type II secretion system minor pseudopilin GspI [Pseudomonas syringae]|nr:type II secretion system minor pseudopilin GspI [Pseudomonas syringae]MBD8575688.1 type II secretion system minor pseudopilin GspI [Pseudomonas syringae]MBD8788533.1 type II secretion system minor pseudopilin GspI [Pseudomonas syringae]MBD8801591.1 type II secretion system minor pseudopilin GspI [Pseudomonas syringae]MBD8811464.1 type II secretion system minor pseudopilin GspI [Pseudomonas syringae]
MSTERGFTLLEVMVALAVFATVAVAVLSACQFVLGQRDGLRERLFAAWLADNHLTELRLKPPAVGRQRIALTFANQAWTLEQHVERDRLAPMLGIELSVRRDPAPAVLYRTHGWVAVPVAQGRP